MPKPVSNRGANPAAHGRVDAGKDPEKGRLAGAVVPDQSDPVAVLDGESDLVERLHQGGVTGSGTDPPARAGSDDAVLQGPAHAVIDREVDGDVVKTDLSHS
jgi:hypothetical protein